VTQQADAGAILVLALVYIVAIGLIVGALTSWVMGNLNSTRGFATATAMHYAATSTTDTAIQSIRYHPMPSSPTLDPNTPTTLPVSNCWANVLTSNLTIDGYNMTVWCQTVEYLKSSQTRVVSFYTCPTTPTLDSTTCMASPYLKAIVTFNDYPEGGLVTYQKQCNLLNVLCGSGVSIDTWIWSAAASGAVVTPTTTSTTTTTLGQAQTVAFYNSSYSTPLTSDSVALSAGTYQLYARGSRGGSITFATTSSGICSVDASTGVVTLQSTGTCALTADAGAKAPYADSGPTSFALSIGNSPTSVVVSSSGPSSVNQTVTLTASVSSNDPGTPTGTVSFSDGGTSITGCTSQAVSTSTGNATCQTSFSSSGSHQITAQYSGDANFAPSTSPAFTQTVSSTAYQGQTQSNLGGNYYNNYTRYFYIDRSGSGSSQPRYRETYVSTTLSALTFSLSDTANSPVAVSIWSDASGYWQNTGLGCTVSSGSSSCSATGNVDLTDGAYVSVQISWSGRDAGLSASWSVAYS
jgi:Bacterial Ig-like domain (group 3)